MKPIPYDEIEAPVRELCRALNEFPGIRTYGSCGGHENPDEWQQPLGSWFVTFGVSLKAGGWRSLEQIGQISKHYVDFQNHTARITDTKVKVTLNASGGGILTGRSHFFCIEGQGVDAEDVAQKLREIRDKAHVIVEITYE